ncbi:MULTISPECIES: hypothetical protein [Lactobacillus]|uniref:Uncharacterized protein n=1 Tax=Lactobacillus xujianguonis TaxID=2495899 RepID=A0A437SSY3_9LACO|nr:MULTISPECIES: hypothetical protein [Lactobacillus]RVU69957.1 hypothetical protein EJK17_10175 [Lactobacillus xujianguonis]RVU72344.1 hypothetical protein EJK20_10390 [Lactobacillus xujianguonis]
MRTETVSAAEGSSEAKQEIVNHTEDQNNQNEISSDMKSNGNTDATNLADQTKTQNTDIDNSEQLKTQKRK